MRISRFLLCTALWLGVQGCSTQQFYDGFQAGRRSACQRYAEPDRARCLASNDMDYETYRRQRDDMTLK